MYYLEKYSVWKYIIRVAYFDHCNRDANLYNLINWMYYLGIFTLKLAVYLGGLKIDTFILMQKQVNTKVKKKKKKKRKKEKGLKTKHELNHYISAKYEHVLFLSMGDKNYI